MTRDIRILLGLGLSLAFIVITIARAERQPAPHDSRTIQGVVFDDANRNQIRDRTEAGLEGVVVSDQISVTATAANVPVSVSFSATGTIGSMVAAATTCWMAVRVPIACLEASEMTDIVSITLQTGSSRPRERART